MKPRGLYELLLTKALAELLAQLPHNLEPVSEPLRSAEAAEAADRLALHVGRAVQKALEDVPDYAISRDLIHWESQSVTREDSETGLRYRRHVRFGSSILLFARLRTDDRAFWFLGPATYVKHESETPMSLTWRLEHPSPGDLFEQFAAAVA